MTSIRLFNDEVLDHLLVLNGPRQNNIVTSTYTLPVMHGVGDYPVAVNNSNHDLFIFVFTLHQDTFALSQGEITIRPSALYTVDPIWFSDSSSVGLNTSVPRTQCDFVFQKSGGNFATGPLIWVKGATMNIFIQSGDATGMTGKIDFIAFEE